MVVRVDPEGNETRALFELVDFSGKRVLEVGCGDGRLTWRYAGRAARVTAVDPSSDAITRAMEGFPAELRDRVELRQASFEDFTASSESSAFDIAILSWSL